MASNMSDASMIKSEKSRSSSNVINVTTSETMRLDAGDRTNLHLQPIGTGTGGQGYQQKKKNSSFQITSITSRLSNDGGEDSADDTEDISDIADNSRVTDFDQETPSYSEDYSKTEEVFFGPAPVIPTSSQYGITALVQQTGSGGVLTARLPQGVTVNVTEGGIALAKADGESDIEHWQNRFKIVKIDTNEPFKRGRWICLDFMDSPAVNAASSQKKDENTTVIINNVGDKDDMTEHQPQTVLKAPVPVTQQNQTTTQVQSQPVPTSYQVPHSSQAATPMASSAQPTQSGVPMQASPHMTAATTAQGQGTVQYSTQGAPPMQGQLQPSVSQGYASATQTSQGSVHPSPSTQTPPQAQQSLQPQLQQQPPPLQQPTIQQQQQQPPASQPGMQPSIQSANIPQAAVSQPSGQQGLVPASSHAQLPQHQPVPGQAQSSMAQPSINTQSIPQQGMPGQSVNIPQSVAQPGVMGVGGMPAQSLQTKVMSGIPSQGVNMGQPVVSHQGVPPQTVMSQPQQPGVQVAQQQTLPPQSVPTQNVAQNPQQLNQSLPSKPIQQVPTSQQMPSGQQLPVSQQVAAPASNIQSTPATTPAHPLSHLTMTSGLNITDPQQSPQPPTNLEGIPIGQPMDDANATPPAPSGSQPEDTESFRGLAHALSCGVFPNYESEEVAPPRLAPPSPSNSASSSIGIIGVSEALMSSSVASPCHTPPPPPAMISLAVPPQSPLQRAPPIAVTDVGVAVTVASPVVAAVAAAADKDPTVISASSASTVAIDNKIEQAMDLVKSHLMFAVREEVEVLKEKISELMERISQLEYENTVLRQYATQEALQQLQQPHHSSNT